MKSIIGKVMTKYRGDYSATVAYDIADLVRYRGSIYMHVATEPTTGTAPTEGGDNATWALMLDGGAIADLEERAAISAANAGVSAQTASNAAASASSDASRAETAKSQIITEEAERQEAETARVNAEAVRKSNESARKVAESGRVSAESSRTNAESARVSAENERESRLDAAIAAIPDRVDSAIDTMIEESLAEAKASGEFDGNVMYATFEVDENSDLLMHTPDGYNGPQFRLNENYELEVVI